MPHHLSLGKDFSFRKWVSNITIFNEAARNVFDSYIKINIVRMKTNRNEHALLIKYTEIKHTHRVNNKMECVALYFTNYNCRSVARKDAVVKYNNVFQTSVQEEEG